MYTYQEALNSSIKYFNGDQLAAEVFLGKYALTDSEGNLLEKTPEDMHRRLAREFARIENKFPNEMSEEEIFELFDKFRWICPQGSPMSGIGNKFQVQSLSNCFSLEPVVDSYGGILKTDQELVQIAKRRGGVGFDISNLRPKGKITKNAAKTTDGIAVFMERFSNSTREVAQSGRRGACLLSISVHHPEIETFITIKNNLKKITGANLSIRLSDEFMNAVKNKEEVELRWPVDSKNPEISERVNATKIWNKICKSAYNYAEPGVLFWDTIINNTPSDAYATKGFNSVGVNPCSELILSSNDACRLLLINAFSFVEKPFTKNAGFDWKKFVIISNKAQRLMDDMVELEIECLDKILEKIENDPEPEEVKFVEKKMWLNIKEKAIQGRRTGTGLTGIGDVLAALGIQYGSKKSIKIVEKIYKHLAIGCYQATIEMAKERGRFPIYENKLEEKNKYLQKIISSLEPKYQKDYKSHGRRNIALTTTAPAGSVSLLTQTSSGIEPVFKLEYTRRKKITENIPVTQVDFVDDLGDKWQEFMIRHHGYQKWIDINKSKEKFNSKHSPYHGSTSAEIDWVAGVQLQAAAQKWIDHSISRTTNLPSNAILSDVKNIYMKAWQSKCKGLTVYREGSRSGVLVDKQNTTNNRKTLIENHAPKRPESLPCDIYHITVDYNKWNAFVGLYEGKPFEIFAGLAKYVKIPKKYTKGRIEKHNGGNVSTHYDLCFGDDPDDEMVIQDIDQIFENPTGAAFTRVVSLSLRHGTPVQYAVEQIQKGSVKESNLFSLNKAVARVLKNYIIDGTKPSQKKCSECGGTDLAYEEGCVSCCGCGHSRCG